MVNNLCAYALLNSVIVRQLAKNRIMSVNLFVRKRDESKRCDTYEGAHYLLT